MNSVKRTEQQATLDAARAGDAAANWQVYEHFQAFSRAHGLPQAQAFDFLRRAVDGGLPDAQFELAKLLRTGWATLDSAGQISATDVAPSQGSLDEARRLVGLAAAQGHERAQHMLDNLAPDEWHEGAAHRSSFGVGVRMLHDPIEEAEADARPSPALRTLAWIALAVAVAALLWGAWALYSVRMADRLSTAALWPGLS